MDKQNMANFINDIIKTGNLQTIDKVEELIIKFKDYLEATKSIDEEDINWINNIINNLQPILMMTDNGVSFDLTSLRVESGKKVQKKSKSKPKTNRHYAHYHEDSSDSCTGTKSRSSACGGSGSSSSSCGSSSCGCGTDRC